MSEAVTNSLSKEKMQQLLAAVGSAPADDTAQVEAAEYDWNHPHCFSSAQLEKLDDLTQKVAHACAEKFAQLYNSDFNVTITSTTQHFAGEFTNTDNASSDYYLTFGTNHDQQFGLVGIPHQTAITWTTQLLGDVKSAENSDRDLSQLEQSLLFDIASGVIKAFSDSYDNYDFHLAAEIVRGQLPAELKATDQLCKITFSVEKSGSKNGSQAYFLIRCEQLKPVITENAQTTEDLPAEIIAKAMLGHMHKVPVSLTARLASTTLTFEEMISLHVDDILLLDKRVTEPVELIIEGRTILHGRPAKSNGRYAVVVTQICK